VVDRSSPQPLSLADIAAVQDGAKTANPDLRLACAYALGLIDEPDSRMLTARLAADHDQLVRDAAQFGILLAELRSKPAPIRFARLHQELESTTGPLYRQFVVNWLGAEFGREALPILRQVLRDEVDSGPLLETMYFLVLYGDPKDRPDLQKTIDAYFAGHRLIAQSEALTAVFTLLRPGPWPEMGQDSGSIGDALEDPELGRTKRPRSAGPKFDPARE